MARKASEINKTALSRLRSVIEASGMTQKAFSERVGLHPKTISGYLNEHEALSEQSARLIVSQFPGVSLAWLLGIEEESQEDYALRKIAQNFLTLHDRIDATGTYLCALGFSFQKHNDSVTVSMINGQELFSVSAGNFSKLLEQISINAIDFVKYHARFLDDATVYASEKTQVVSYVPDLESETFGILFKAKEDSHG